MLSCATWHLVRTLGRKRAYEKIVTGEKISAHKCLELGLCNRVVPDDELLKATVDWAEELTNKAPLALRYCKQAVLEAGEQALGEAMSSEATLQLLCVSSEDASEGIAAFIEKRKPIWKGR